MMTVTTARTLRMGASAMTLAMVTVASAAFAEDAPPAMSGRPQTQSVDIAEGSDIVVTATTANRIAPVTASLQTTQPQSIVSRSFIEDSLPATADFNQIASISPSVSITGNANGAGLSESKAQIRGFQDGEYNITYDGVPFGDTNDPTHHSNTFFPSNTIETLIVDRGPGNASQLGQATFGGNMNLFSRATRENPGVELKGTYGTFRSIRAAATTPPSCRPATTSARYDIGPVRIGAEINNLLDSRRVTNISTGKTAPFDPYFYQTGRAFTGDVTVTF